MKKQDIKFLQSGNTIRGIACLSVVIFHYYAGFLKGNGSEIFTYGGSIGVSMFFVLSGFLMPFSMLRKSFVLKDTWVYLKKRFYRLFPVFACGLVFSQILYLVSGMLFDFFPLKNFSTSNFFTDLFFLTWAFEDATWVNIVHWTIDVEIQYYLIIIPIVLILKKYNAFISLILITVTLALFQHYILKDTYLYWHTILKWFPFFALGLITCCYFLNRISITSMLILSSILMCYILVNFKPQECLGAVIPFGIILFDRYVKIKWLDWIGIISFSLYLLHVPLMSVFKHYLVSIGASQEQKLLYFIPLLVLIITLSFLFYIAIEKPTMDISSRLKYKRQID
jgi:peptidoglycan/LPS O-acetylase OafA/YrhL